MSGWIERVRPGAEAEDSLCSWVLRLQGGDALAPVSVAVRSPVVGFDLRRRLAERGAFAGTHFLPLNRLAELVGAGQEETAGGRRPLTRAALGASVRTSLRASPGVFGGVLDHPATEESLAQVYRLARQLSETDRRRVASMSERAHDVMVIVEGARRLVEEAFYDVDDLARAAARQVESGEADLSGVGPVVLHLPDPPAPAQLDLLEALARHGEVAALVGELGDEAADRATSALCEELSRRGFVAASISGPRHEGLSFNEVIGAPDLEEEVRSALRILVDHAESGGDLGKSALVLPASVPAESYLALIEELFGRAGLSWTAPAHGALAETAAGRLVVETIELLLGEGEAFERSRVVRLLSSPALRPSARLVSDLAGLICDDGERLRVGAFDRCSRAAGVVGGPTEWAARLAGYARRPPERLTQGAPAEVAGDLARLVARLVALRSELRGATSFAEVARLAVKIVEEVVAPGEEQDRLAEAVFELSFLDPLEELSPFVPLGSSGRAPFELQVSSALSSVLAAGAPGRGRFGKGPVVGSLSSLAGIRTDLLVLLGAGEGVLPGRRPEDPLVTEVEREGLDLLAELEETEERDRRMTLTLLAAAGRSVASYPRVSRGATRAAYPSRWLSGDLFHGVHEQVPSFSGAIDKVARGELAAADETDLELALIRRGSSEGRRLSQLFLGGLSDLGERLGAEQERRHGALTRFGGFIGASELDGTVFGEVMSATRMESLARCPMQFMFERLVRLKVLEAPDRRHTIDPRDKGTLIHAVLQEVVDKTMIETGTLPSGEEALAACHEVAERRFAELEERGLSGKPVYFEMAKAEVMADLEHFVLAELARLAESGGRPLRTELSFGSGKELPAVVVALDASTSDGDTTGRTMSFRGQVDRVDAEPGGLYRVIDYKSGSSQGFGRLDVDPLDGGRHLQLPIYAKAVTPLAAESSPKVIAEFRFCSAGANFKRVPVELTSELDRQLGETLSVLGGTVERGTFPPRPGNGEAFSNCRFCDYDSICRLDRSLLWEKASEHESMTSYVELVSGRAK